MDDSLVGLVDSLNPLAAKTSGELVQNAQLPSNKPTIDSTGQMQAPRGDLEQAILSGTKTFSPSQTVNVVDQNGDSYNVPGNEVAKALRQGYRLETSRETAIRDVVNENKGLTGSAKVALKQFGNQALFGIPEIIEEKTGDPFEIAKSRAIKEDHSFANAVGGVAGFGASLVVGGPLFKAAGEAGQVASKVVAKNLAKLGIEEGAESLAKTIVAKTAQNAAKYGVEGALIETPKAITETVLGDPEAGAEALMMGGGLGMGLGLASGPAGIAFKKLMPKGVESVTQGLKSLRDERVAKALGFTKGQIKKVGGQEAAEEVANHLFNSKLSTGQDVIGPMSSTEDILNNVIQLRTEAGAKIGDLYKTLDEIAPQSVDVNKLEAFLKTEMTTKYSSGLRKQENNVLNTILEDLRAIKGEGAEGINFADAKGFLDDIATVAYPKGKMPLDPTPRQAVAAEVWGKLRGQIDEAADKAAQSSGQTDLYENLLGARKDYSMSLRAEKSLADKISSESGNKLIGLTDTILGTGAGAAGGPITGFASVLAKKALEKYGNVLSAELLDRSIDGVLAVSKFMNKTASKLNEVPGVFDVMSKGRELITPTVGKTVSAISRLVGDENLSKEKSFEKLSSKINDWMSNQAALADHVSNQTALLQQTGAPNVGAALNNKMMSSVQYIYQNMPKPMTVSTPFHDVEYKPSDLELAAFDRKLSVLMDPFVVIDALKQGTLTKDHMSSLNSNYPILAQAIRGRIFNHISENKQKLSYQSRLKMSLLMGVNTDSSMTSKNISAYQNSFAMIPEVNHNELNQSGLMKMKPAEQAMTAVQKGLKT